MPAAISVKQLSRHYGALTAIDAVSFDVEEGEIFGLLGPNGAGKTTTLECILGLVRADQGKVLVLGKDVRDHPLFAKTKIGAVLQATGLQDKITPQEALRLYCSFYANPLPSDVLLDRFGLWDKRSAAFETLSGGQKQRLALALAFAGNPRILVLDEPCQGLDPSMRKEIHDHIAAIKKQGASVLLATHDMDEAERLCDRLAVIAHGHIVACATPHELIARFNVPHLQDAVLKLVGPS